MGEGIGRLVSKLALLSNIELHVIFTSLTRDLWDPLLREWSGTMLQHLASRTARLARSAGM